jgi:hypothetical protein
MANGIIVKVEAALDGGQLVAKEVGTVIEIEGVWVDETYIEVKEAEVENEDDSEE